MITIFCYFTFIITKCSFELSLIQEVVHHCSSIGSEVMTILRFFIFISEVEFKKEKNVF